MEHHVERRGAADKAANADEDTREPSLVLQSMLCAVAALEGADSALLGASIKALIQDIGLELHDISYMAMAQMICTNLAAPLWGIFADRGILSRRTILILGSLGQGVVTALLAFITGLGPMIFLRAMNGVMLAALRPISNGIIADVTAESKRGKVFGRVQSALLLGMFVTGMTVLPMSTERILGIQGWRVAYVILGLISVVVCVYIWSSMPQIPGNEKTKSQFRGAAAVLEEVRSLAGFLRMPTFCIMILQGIFGTIPWSVMTYMSLFYQLSGLSNVDVAILGGAGPLIGAIGNVIGGVVSDFLARRLGLYGRPLNAQITVAFAIPLMFLIFMGIPPGHGNFWAYMALSIAFGLLGSWAQSGTNFPILAHIVPAEARSRIMAWECALENSIANAVGPIAASLLAEKVFGYTFGQAAGTGKDIPSAVALGKAMTATICLPWVVCFVFYSILHWTYPRDVRILEAKLQAEREQQQKESHKEDPELNARMETNSEKGEVVQTHEAIQEESAIQEKPAQMAEEHPVCKVSENALRVEV